MLKPFVEIIRLEINKTGIISSLIIDNEWFCITLERPWKDNRPNISCIPTGLYKCKRVKSGLVRKLTRYVWDETFEVIGVEGRSLIRFHSGNFPYNSKGCILVGSHAGKLRDENDLKRAILNSGKTFNRFMNQLININEFYLQISFGR